MNMKLISAGLLAYRRVNGELEVLLAHPGGPFFQNKDDRAWTIPKGEPNPGEEMLQTARREFFEETGFTAADTVTPLATIKQKGGKVVHAWALEQDIDVAKIVSNSFTMEWPPRSGKQTSFPEVDRAAYFDLNTARLKINPAQAAWLDELQRIVSARD